MKEEYTMETTPLRTVSPNQAKKSITRAFKKKRSFLCGDPALVSPILLDRLTIS